ncbi:GPI inositol-deacylase [Massilia pinisoli]|uniref:GPI inositol-deacylase n=1 Tax=Massilia pinisoli TaxID=1772194 RepID=A0ABT1ZXD8_9BURK|nr:GPI inositol-deacylase [Massilia pinisoli]MCS0584530.1 GPI inositol-deacylase [Massilia pinisoli]
MSNEKGLNERGNHQAEFSQGVGGWAEYAVYMTDTSDTVRHDIKVPPGKVIPVIFLPGVMGSNLRMSKKRQDELQRKDDNRAWRPDDMLTLSDGLSTLFKKGYGGEFRKASPAQRQLTFDPNETEVEYYHYTESNGRFDPGGKETLASDKRHKNVPDELAPIPPLIRDQFLINESRGSERRFESAAQIARWRGWSEVLFAGAYGEMLKTTERYLNNISRNGQLDPYGEWNTSSPNSLFGPLSGLDLKIDDLKRVANCWYPVHAMGYNYLKSNADSAKVIADRIRGLVQGYQKRGFKCSEVIIVTHSMGGLVARALIHPKYGNLLNDHTVRVLGIYHNVMPTLGAAAAYRRMRFGFLEKQGIKAEIFADIVGIDGENATAILANAPAPLELLPATGYGKDWLKVVDGTGRTIRSWPSATENALTDIYLKPQNNWWRLINPDWVNPGKVSFENGGGITRVQQRLMMAYTFLDAIEKTFHPTQCYASFCVSNEHKSYGSLTFKIANADVSDSSLVSLPPADTWKLLSDDKKGTLTVQAGTRVLKLTLQPPDAPGDETVPAERSAHKITGMLFPHGKVKGTGYEHQDSYTSPFVLGSMLYSIIKIATTAKWN